MLSGPPWYRHTRVRVYGGPRPVPAGHGQGTTQPVISKRRCYTLPAAVDKAHAGLILDLSPVNERRRYKVTPSLIGWAQT